MKMLERMKKLLKQKEDRRSELGVKAKKTEDIAELRSINSEIEAINEEMAEIRGIIAQLEEEEKASEGDEKRAADPEAGEEPEQRGEPGKKQVIATYGAGSTGDVRSEINQDTVKQYEQRGAELKGGKAVVISPEATAEERAVTVASSNLVVQKKYSSTIADTFNDVSGLIDRVAAVPLNGGESYSKSFVTGYGEGDYKAEGEAYASAEPTFDSVEIGKAKITAYAEITEEVEKLPNLDYVSYVSATMRRAIRKKITKQILAGTGGTNALTGIFSAPANVIPLASDIEISAIDETTLDKIVFGYGGDEDVEGQAVLVLNKADLAAFNAVRFTDGKRAYKIKLNADGNSNSGTITSEGSFEVPFIINSAAPALSADATTVDTYCMAYGKLAAYEMPVFSPLTVQKSTDFKFSTGQIAYRASIYAGGNVSVYKGFARIKKVAAV